MSYRRAKWTKVSCLVLARNGARCLVLSCFGSDHGAIGFALARKEAYSLLLLLLRQSDHALLSCLGT